MNARRLALRAARIGWVGGALSFALRHFSSALPIKKVYEDADAVAFFHPAPSAQPHILIVPKARARTAFDLSEALFRAALRAGAEIARRYCRSSCGSTAETGRMSRRRISTSIPRPAFAGCGARKRLPRRSRRPKTLWGSRSFF